jgi:SEC-C motif domain protein
MKEHDTCPCGSLLYFANCCQPILNKTCYAESAEALMRSRYSAYATQALDYICDSMLPPAALQCTRQQLQQWNQHNQWIRLKICDHQAMCANQATICFLAIYLHQGETRFIYEKSLFQKIGEQWFYTDGKHLSLTKNTLCPCGSKKKFKRCCYQLS